MLSNETSKTVFHLNFSALLEFLHTCNTKPKKGLSQNFLIDPNIVQKIVDTAQITPGEKIWEIGAGPGALTSALLKAGAHVHAVEMDPIFAEKLWRLQTPDQRLTVYRADILEFPLPPHSKIVANLPYHITTPILEKVFSTPFQSCTIMIQKELAERLMAQPGTKDFSSLTLFLQFYGSIVDSFKVSSECFYPRPQVDSTVIKIDFRAPPLSSPEPFFKTVRRAYQQRRKMMSSSLQELYSAEKIREGLEKIGVRSDARPEMLGLKEWLNFFETMSQTASLST